MGEEESVEYLRDLIRERENLPNENDKEGILKRVINQGKTQVIFLDVNYTKICTITIL